MKSSIITILILFLCENIFSEIPWKFLNFIETGYYSGLTGELSNWDSEYNIFTENELNELYKKYEWKEIGDDDPYTPWMKDGDKIIYKNIDGILTRQKTRIRILRDLKKINSKVDNELQQHEKRLIRKAEFHKLIQKNDFFKLHQLLQQTNKEELLDGLILAALIATPETVNIFLTEGANANGKDYLGNTPLNAASRNSINENADIEIAKLLLKNGANPNDVIHGSLEFTKLLLENGADPDKQLSESFCNIDKIKLCLSYGANIDFQNEDGMTKLMEFSGSSGSESYIKDIISFFVENNADLNLIDYNNHSAIYYAVLKDNLSFTKELLEHNASININGDKGETLAKLAKDNKNFTILKLLEKYGYIPDPTELWNGFTDQMTKEQVISRGNKTFNQKGEGYSVGPGQDIITTIAGFLPTPDEIITYRSPDDVFYHHKSAGYISDDRNIWFSFYDDKLYSVRIDWNLSIKDSLIKEAKEKYGSDFLIKRDSLLYNGTFVDYLAYYWNLEDKDVYIYNSNSNQNPLLAETLELHVFSKSGIEKYQVDLKEKQNQPGSE